jgi:nucleotide-binding universal stress UspA family protein
MTAPGMEFGFSAVTLPDMKPYLESIGHRMRQKGLKVMTVTRMGTPAHEIVSLASEIGAGLITLATHGRTGVRRALMGSVAEQVFRTSPCPILVQPAARLSGVLRRMGSEFPARS